MLDMPDAIAIVGVLGTISVGVLRFTPAKNGYVRKELCQERSGRLLSDIAAIKSDVAEVKRILIEPNKKD